MVLLQLTADVGLIAAGDGPKPRRVSIVAYSGGIMSPGNWGPIIIDLQGLTLASSIPLLGDHKNDLESVVGSGRPRIDAGRLLVDGELTATPLADHVMSLHRANVKLQASVGVEPTSIETPKTPTVVVNGRTHQVTLGLRIVRAGVLREVSLTALGADSTTSVTIAASMMKGHPMEPNESTTQETTTTTATLPPEVQAHRTAMAAESRRIGLIQASLKSPAAQAEAIEQGWDSERIAIEAARESYRTEHLAELRATAARAPAVHSKTTTGLSNEVLSAAFTMRTQGDAAAEKCYAPRTLEAAKEYRRRSLVDVCRSICAHYGAPISSMGTDEIIRAAMSPSRFLSASSGFSTISLPVALADSANKSLALEYKEFPATWRAFSEVVSANDFREHTRPRVDLPGRLQEVGATGEIQHDEVNEENDKFSIATFAKMLAVSRQMLINDDLGVFDNTPKQFARMASRSLSDLVWKTILANVDPLGGSFFSGGRNNLLTGSTSALGFDSLTLAVKQLRLQTDAGEGAIDLRPKTLVVSPSLEVPARQLLNSQTYTRDQGTDLQPTGNPLAGLIGGLEVEARLGILSFTSNAIQWYLFSDASNGVVLVAFLDGRQAPVIEVADTDFSTLGMQWRCYHDFGCSLGDHRGAIKSNGS